MPLKWPGSSVSNRGRKKARVDTTLVGHLSEPQPTYVEEDVGPAQFQQAVMATV